MHSPPIKLNSYKSAHTINLKNSLAIHSSNKLIKISPDSKSKYNILSKINLKLKNKMNSPNNLSPPPNEDIQPKSGSAKNKK
jgi:hypothetical protein